MFGRGKNKFQKLHEQQDVQPVLEQHGVPMNTEFFQQHLEYTMKKLQDMFGKDIVTQKTDPAFIERMKKYMEFLIQQEQWNITAQDRPRFIQFILDNLLGFGVLQPLLEDPTITEIMVVGPSKIFIERRGKTELTNAQFASVEALRLVIDKIIQPINRRCDESTPNVDARLPDGSRVSASIAPIALNGPYLTIRKFSKKTFTFDDYIEKNAISEDMATFLEAAVQAKLNIVVSGGTGSGKTTLLNCLSLYISENDRILTIEDNAELQLNHPHLESYEARPMNVEGKGEITIRDLVKNALRKRPDRLIVGEVRGAETMDMLSAMSTGHDGSLTTGHANSPKEMMNRLEIMTLFSGMDLPIRAVREMITGAVHLVVQAKRLRDGSRKIVAITEVIGFGKDGADRLGLKSYDKDAIILQDIFRFEQSGVDHEGKVIGEFVATGHLPLMLERMESLGIILDREMFNKKEFTK